MGPLPGTSAKSALQAIDKAIVMGTNMDGNLLKAAAEAHHKAIGSIDAQGVSSLPALRAPSPSLSTPLSHVTKKHKSYENSRHVHKTSFCCQPTAVICNKLQKRET